MVVDQVMRIGFISFAMKVALACVLAIPFLACSHHYHSNELDLAFYQWNKWHDREAEAGVAGAYRVPSGGWEAFNRGRGELVRIPSEVSDSGGIAWYHCRFTLPEHWKEHQISLEFKGIAPVGDVYLNEILVGSVPFSEDPFTIDVSDPVNYTLDNHLAICVVWKEGGTTGNGWGVTGSIIVRANMEPR